MLAALSPDMLATDLAYYLARKGVGTCDGTSLRKAYPDTQKYVRFKTVKISLAASLGKPSCEM